MTFRWPRSNWYWTISQLSQCRLWDDLEMIPGALFGDLKTSNIAGLQHSESEIKAKCLGWPLSHVKVIARLRKPCNFWENVHCPLKIIGQITRQMPAKSSSYCRNRAVTMLLPRDFKENEAIQRKLGARMCNVTMALAHGTALCWAIVRAVLSPADVDNSCSVGHHKPTPPKK